MDVKLKFFSSFETSKFCNLSYILSRLFGQTSSVKSVNIKSLNFILDACL